MLKGQTWNAADGKYFGLMDSKKALIIVSSGGFYNSDPTINWEHVMSLTMMEFKFMMVLRCLWNLKRRYEYRK
ncbi:MAG: hypothetical protein ACYDAJ_10690 [Nitrosotalea sp.]